MNQESNEINYQFEELYMRYEQMVYNITVKILNNHHLSEEAVQLTFLRFYEKIINGYKFNEVATGTALFLIARGEAITLLTQTIHDQQMVDEIASVINKLPLEEQKIFNLRFYGKLTTKEISKALETNENTIKTKISRITIMIRELLKDKYLIID